MAQEEGIAVQIAQIKTKGFVQVPYPPRLQSLVAEAACIWECFCGLIPEHKESMASSKLDMDAGYTLREGKGPHADRKEYFHVSRAMSAVLKRLARKDNREAIELIDITEDLIGGITPLISEFSRRLEGGLGIKGFTRDVLENRNGWVIRYIHYFPGTLESQMAHAHTDRGGFTLHLHETHPGAEYLDSEEVWKPLPVGKHETVLFPSMGLQFHSGSRLNALCHRVVPTKDAAREGRYSMVAFINFRMRMRYNDAFPLQKFAPGFNYGMPMDMLEKFFIPA